MEGFESLLAVIEKLETHAVANWEHLDANLREMKTEIKAIRE